MSSRECTSSAASMRSATLRYLTRGARLTDTFCSRELETVRTVQTAETPTGSLPTLLKRRAQHSLRDDGAGPSPPAVRTQQALRKQLALLAPSGMVALARAAQASTPRQVRLRARTVGHDRPKERAARRTESSSPAGASNSRTKPGGRAARRRRILELKQRATRPRHPQPHGDGGGERIGQAQKLRLRLHVCSRRTEQRTQQRLALAAPRRTCLHVLSSL